MPDKGMDAAAVPVPDAGDDTLREQLARILTEHQFAFSVDRCAWLCACSGPPMPRHDDALRHVADALLPRIREHIAAAVQAERERVSALLASIPDEWYPKDVFGSPFSTDESRQVNEALREHGFTIDRVSANVMRYAFRDAARIAREDPTTYD